MIESRRLKLKEVQLNDCALLTTWWNDGRVMKDVGYPDGIHMDEEKVKEHVKKIINKGQSTQCMYIIYVKDTNKAIGEIMYQNVDKHNKSCEIGLKICDVHEQGKGYGKEALQCFLRYLFQHFQLQRIYLDTLLENTRAQNLYKKVGFKEIGVTRNVWLDPTGTYRSALLMDVLVHELE